MEKKKYFDILQIYRGIASLAVVLHHTYASFAHFHQLDLKWVKFLASLGKLGVDFFFVLSGFIIAYTTYNYRDKISYIKKYIFNRILRIYVPYLPISFAMLLLYFLMPSFSNSDRTISILTSIFLIPHGNPALSVGWTLVFEMFFYIIYSLNFFSIKLWYISLIAWVSAILAVYIFNVQSENKFLSVVLSWYNIEFIFGVFVAYLLKNNYLKAISKAFVFVPILLFASFIYLKVNDISYFPFSQNLLFALSAAGFVFFGVQHFNKKISNRNILMLLGNSSFSLYLLHNPMQSFLVRWVPKVESQFLLLLELMIVILICCVISYFYYLIFEKYLISLLKKKFANYDS